MNQNQKSSTALRRIDPLIAAAVAFGTLLVLLSLHAIADIPRNDDFSYAHTAESLARTGHMVYNGWGSPALFPQALVGAILIRIYGFSYAVLQWVGIASGVAAAGVMYLLSRACGLSWKASLSAIAVLVGNPMFLGTAPTFMTELPSLLLFLLAFYLLVTSLAEAEGGTIELKRIRFFTFVLMAILSGSNRQISSVACVGALLPIAFSLRSRDDKLLVVFGGGLIAFFALAITDWLNRQPYNVPADIAPGLDMLLQYRGYVALFIYKFTAILGIFTFPFVLSALRFRDLRNPAFWCAVMVNFAILVIRTGRMLSCLNPYLGILGSGQYFTSRGSPNYFLNGAKTMEPTILPPVLVHILMLTGMFSLGASLYLMLLWVVEWRQQGQRQNVSAAPVPVPERKQKIVATAMALASLTQVAASIPWFAEIHMFDRYFLFYFPGLFIFLLSQASLRHTVTPLLEKPLRILKLTSIALYIASLSGMSYVFAATMFNSSCAEATLYHRLRQAGVPQNQIDNGFELDADAQVTLQGHMNNHEMHPSRLYHPEERGINIDLGSPELYPAMDGHYLFSESSNPIAPFPLDPQPVDQIVFRRLLPPYKMTLYVWRDADGQTGTPHP